MPQTVRAAVRAGPAAIIAVAACALAPSAGASAPATRSVPAPAGIHLTIRTTAHGIPHMLAGDYRSLGFGVGWAEAHDDLCPTADAFLTVDAQRSRFLGPNGSYDETYVNGTAPNNLQSDFFYAKVIKQGAVERLLDPARPDAPLPQARAAVEGYAEGYDAALADERAPAGITDPACKGQPWVRPISAIDVWRRVYQLALLASSGVDIDGVVAAAPPAGGALRTALAMQRQAQALARPHPDHLNLGLRGIGSNAIGLGSAATSDGHGILLGNPHVPWQGPERFYQFQLTLPGQIDAAGVGFLGVPAILNGFTRGVAWSNTDSTARAFAIYQLSLVPGSPTSYTVDGQTRQMRTTTVSVDVKHPDGTIGQQSHTFYDTDYGPVISSISGLPVFPWTLTSAFAMFDANAENLGRVTNQFFAYLGAQSVPELDSIVRRYQGLPWAQTIAADSAGHAYYTDAGSYPNIDVDRYSSCLTQVGQVADQQYRLAVLDGSTSRCAPGRAAGAAAAGILPPSREPTVIRDDYVENSNDSYWLVNASHLITGYSRILGDEATARLFRTRFGIKSVEDRLAGRDGLPGDRFTPAQVMDLVFNDVNYEAQLWLKDVEAMCESHPIMVGSNGPVDVSGACPALHEYDLHENRDSRGALLFRRFSEHVWLDSDASNPWADQFDPHDPVNTPAKLNTNDAKVQRSFANAVSDLRGAGIPFDAPVRDFAYAVRNGQRIPMHGGPGVGEFNVITDPFDPKRGYPDVVHGSSYVEVVRPTGGCPDAHTIQTYSQSTDPTSPYYADQTRMYSAKQWITFPFCEQDILSDPALHITNFGVGFPASGPAARSTLIRSIRIRRQPGHRLAVLVRLTTRGTVNVTVLHGHRAIRRAMRTGRTIRMLLRRIPRRALAVRITATAGQQNQVVTRKLTRHPRR